MDLQRARPVNWAKKYKTAKPRKPVKRWERTLENCLYILKRDYGVSRKEALK